MLFVVDKPQFQRTIAIVRDDRTRATQGSASPFMRLEVQDAVLKLDGLEVSATIPATVYESGVLFLKVTALRRILQTIRGEQFVTIQVTTDELLLDNVRLPLEANEMLLYPDPMVAPQTHPTRKSLKPKSESTHSTQSMERQLMLWDDVTDEDYGSRLFDK